MKARENLLRLKHFQVEDKTRQLAQIDMMVAEEKMKKVVNCCFALAMVKNFAAEQKKK